VLTIYAIDTASRLGLACTIKLKQKDGCMGAPVATPYRSGCPIVHPHGVDYGLLYDQDQARALFSFLYLKKIKISKIYIRFEIFQKYPRSPPHRATGLK